MTLLHHFFDLTSFNRLRGLRLQEEGGRWSKKLTFCKLLYHTKCKQRGVGGQKKPNLVNVVCERPLLVWGETKARLWLRCSERIVFEMVGLSKFQWVSEASLGFIFYCVYTSRFSKKPLCFDSLLVIYRFSKTPFGITCPRNIPFVSKTVVKQGSYKLRVIYLLN